MYQSFEITASPQFGRERVTRLREAMSVHSIDGFLVPRADEFQGEYVPASAERLAWLTGFTGSAGEALITQSQAIVFVDGRYVTQLVGQTDPEIFTGGDLIGAPAHIWIKQNAPQGFRLGIDPWLHTPGQVARLKEALDTIDGQLILLDANPLDAMWDDRPEPPLENVIIQPVELAGKLASEKLEELTVGLKDQGADALLVCDPSSVAWAFNIRGNDVPHTPHPLARAIFKSDGSAEIFIDGRKVNREVKAYLTQLSTISEPETITDRLTELGKAGQTLSLDAAVTPQALAGLFQAAGGKIVEATDPCALPRAIKNDVELQGSRQAHLQDGAAMVEFLYWLDQQPAGSVAEVEAVRQLEGARRTVGIRLQNPLKDISFDTISGAGENGAIIHYRVTSDTDRSLNAGELYLVDSGGQYQNGTTDITRTIAIGDVGETEKRFFTLVLKGMIAISQAHFPKATRGVDLDPLARIALWKAGADYGHGTGHGVGSYLSVHEGPQRISRAAMQELLPGMILSNEPGYYRPGHFGIRIENLIAVRPEAMIEGGDRPMMSFETLTFCPIDKRLIDTSLLSRDELRWLDDYHQETRDKLLPFIEDADIKAWLEDVTSPLPNRTQVK